MTRGANMEHVEVLRAMLADEYPEGSDDGSPTFTLERAALTAAIASLSAPQPPAEAQAQGGGEVVAWEWEYVGNDPYPRGKTVARALHEMDPQNPPYPETWRPTRPLVYGDASPQQPPATDGAQPVAWRWDHLGDTHYTDDELRVEGMLEAGIQVTPLYAYPPPSAPVGVEGLPERWRREAPQAGVDSGEDAARAYREAMHWCAFQLEEALAQRPAPTLPGVDDDDLTVAYMAGRHDGRKEAQQPAAVDEVHEMFLCESSRLYLSPDRLYRFTVDPDCSLCAEALSHCALADQQGDCND